MSDKQNKLKELEAQLEMLKQQLEEEEPEEQVVSEEEEEEDIIEAPQKTYSKQYTKYKDDPDYREKNRLRSKEWYERKKDTDNYKEKRRHRVREYMRKQFENNTEVGQRMRDAAVIRYWRRKKEQVSPEKYKRALVMLEYRSPERAQLVIERIGY